MRHRTALSLVATNHLLGQTIIEIVVGYDAFVLQTARLSKPFLLQTEDLEIASINNFFRRLWNYYVGGNHQPIQLLLTRSECSSIIAIS